MRVILFSVFLFFIISCQKEQQAPQLKVTLTTTASDSLKSATIYLFSLKVHSSNLSTQEEEIPLFQNDNGLILIHDLSGEQTTTLIDQVFYEGNLSSIESFFSIAKLGGQPTQLFHVYNDYTPINHNLSFPINSTLENGRSYEINIKVPIDEAITIQRGSTFDWAKVIVTIKEL